MVSGYWGAHLSQRYEHVGQEFVLERQRQVDIPPGARLLLLGRRSRRVRALIDGGGGVGVRVLVNIVSEAPLGTHVWFVRVEVDGPQLQSRRGF